jgi:hypothetical protein
MRGAKFYVDSHGLYWPFMRSLHIIHQAIEDVAEAMGVPAWEYWVLLEREGPDILKRLPGMSEHVPVWGLRRTRNDP